MQSVNDFSISSTEFPTAEELREITATPEDLFKRQVEDTKSNIMTTMVRLAKEQGRTSYGVQIRADNSSDEFINSIVTGFEQFGYKVTVEDSQGGVSGTSFPVKNITISWE